MAQFKRLSDNKLFDILTAPLPPGPPPDEGPDNRVDNVLTVPAPRAPAPHELYDTPPQDDLDGWEFPGDPLPGLEKVC